MPTPFDTQLIPEQARRRRNFPATAARCTKPAAGQVVADLDGGALQLGALTISVATGEVVADANAPKRRGVFRRVASDLAATGEATPSSNTGSQTPGTRPTPGTARSLVDYCSCTFRARNDDAIGDDGLVCGAALERAKETFGPGLQWAVVDKGGYGYARQLRRGDVAVYYGGNVNPDTVFVLARGKGCRQLEAEGVISAPAEYAIDVLEGRMGHWQAFFAGLLRDGVTFPRVDVAFDDLTGALDMDVVEEAVRQGDCSTRFRRVSIDKGLDPHTGETTGHTVSFGARGKHNMFVRIYHKGLQELATGNAEQLVEWVRVELEAHDDRADRLVRELVARGLQSAVEVLWSYLDFKDPGDDTQDENHRYRRRSADWWTAWLDAAAKLRLGCDPVSRTVQKTCDWLSRQVAPALAVVAYAADLGLEWIDAQIEAGAGRLRDTHLAMLAAWSEGRAVRKGCTYAAKSAPA